MAFPARIVRSLDGLPVLDINVADVKANGVAAIKVPENVAAGAPNPYEVNLQENIEKLKLDVEHIVPCMALAWSSWPT